MALPVLSRRGLAAGLAGVAGWLAGGAISARAGEVAPDEETQAAPAMKLSAEDRLDLLELIAVYAWAYDCEDAELLRTTFTPDGVLEVFGKVLGSGKTGFDDMIAHSQEMKGEHGWQHLADHHVFRDYDGDSCKVYSYYTMAESDAAGANLTMRAMGYYVSDCVRGPDGWLFAKRTVTRWNGTMPFAG